jgi:hypothetical protein
MIFVKNLNELVPW